MEAGDRRGAHGTPRYSRAAERRRRLLRRAVPAGAAIVLVAIVLALLAGGGGNAERATAERFATLWSNGDYPGMYALLDAPARRRTTADAFLAAYRAAQETATVRAIEVGRVEERRGDVVPVHLTIRMRAFGTVKTVLELPVSGEGDTMRVAWRETTVFPGLRTGERLSRTTTLPPRAALLARDGTVLAEGAQRSSQASDVSDQIAGSLGPAPPEHLHALRTLGYPDGAHVGLSGLERVFQHELAGTPGGTLLAGQRVLASAQPRAGSPVRTTIDVGVERAAIAALAGRYGGVAAIVPATGEILALAGVAFSALQPPGSTFKIVTLTGALEARVTQRDSSFPFLSETEIEGVTLENANGEYCGGSLTQSFAHSCNTVFAPLGAQLGAQRLVDVAERFGFNRPLPIAGAATSTIPSADAIGDALAVGSSAIGQGLVQATTLQMTSVAATIALRGRRAEPTLRLDAVPRVERVTSSRIARQVARRMRAVVDFGTGTAAAIDGVAVAGKTGTAELASTVPPDEETPLDPTLPPGEAQEDVPEPPETDAWFVGYAPAQRPRIAVGALLVEAGTGGAVAAPAVRQVLVAGLQRKGR